MKKILVLTIAIFSLLACSDDNDNLDPFVGTWYPFSVDGEEVSDCRKKGTISIKEDGTYTTTFYYFYEDECQKDTSSSGTWTNLGDGVYEITEKDDTEEEEIEENDTDTNKVNVSFKDNNNTFVFSNTEEDENGQTVTSTSTFKRK